GPSSPNTPAPACRLTSSTALVRPNRRVRSLISTFMAFPFGIPVAAPAVAAQTAANAGQGRTSAVPVMTAGSRTYQATPPSPTGPAVTRALADRARVAAASASADRGSGPASRRNRPAAQRTDLRGARTAGSATRRGSSQKLSVMTLDGNGRPITLP